MGRSKVYKMIRDCYLPFCRLVDIAKKKNSNGNHSGCQKTASSFLPSLHSLIDRSPCVLRRVCLEGDPEAYTTTQMLQQVSSVTELVIITHPNPRERINSLMATLTISRGLHISVLFSSHATPVPSITRGFFGC